MPENGYPSPVLHMDAQLTKGKGRQDRLYNDVVDRYVGLKKEAQRIQCELDTVANSLRQALERQDHKSLQIAGWSVRLGEDDSLRIEVANG